MSSTLAVGHAHLSTRHRAVVAQSGLSALPRTRVAPRVDGLVEHHLVEVAAPHLPGVPGEELPVLVAARHGDEPGALWLWP